MDELLIPIVGIICMIGLPIVTGMVLGILRIKATNMERMGLINQGIIPPDSPKKRRGTPNLLVSLRNGIVLIALGIGIIVGLLCSEYLIIDRENLFFWVIGASVVFFLGVGYLTYFLVVQKMPHLEQRESEEGEKEAEQE